MRLQACQHQQSPGLSFHEHSEILFEHKVHRPDCFKASAASITVSNCEPINLYES